MPPKIFTRSRLEINTRVGNKLRELREEKGLSLRGLCDNIKRQYGYELNYNLLGKVERGESRIQLEEFISLCIYYQVDLKEFFPELTVTNDKKDIVRILDTKIGRVLVRELSKLMGQDKFLIILKDLLNAIAEMNSKQAEQIQENKKPDIVLKAASSQNNKTN